MSGTRLLAQIATYSLSRGAKGVHTLYVCRSFGLEKQRPQGTEVIPFSFFVFGSLDLVYLLGKVDD